MNHHPGCIDSSKDKIHIASDLYQKEKCLICASLNSIDIMWEAFKSVDLTLLMIIGKDVLMTDKDQREALLHRIVRASEIANQIIYEKEKSGLLVVVAGQKK